MSDFTQEKLITAEEFWDIAQQPEYDNLHVELVRGEIQTMSLAGGEHGVIVMKIGAWMLVFVEDKHLGYVTAAETGFIFFRNPDMVRGPDVGFVRLENAPDGLPKTHIPFPPDLAVEVVSPNDTPRKVLDKVEDYLAAGTQLVWVIYPAEKVADVWRRADGNGLIKQKLTIEDELDGEDVLPGFKLALKRVFAE